LTIELVDMAFMPGNIVLPAETDVTLVIANHGTVAHNFRTLDEQVLLDVRVDVAPGESKAITLNAPAGEYKVFCDIAGHAEAGMGGIMAVR
jgi:uncharacterized cupredoxin-like copper-binding protein